MCSPLWSDCDLDGWSLRTRRGLLPTFPPSPVDFPGWGTWDLTGYCPLPPLGPATDETGSSSLLPTPMTAYSGTSADAFLDRRPAGNGQRRKLIGDLQIVVRDCLLQVTASCLLPTPVAQDSGTSAESYLARKSQDGSDRKAVTSLSVVLQDCLLPTPTAADSRSGAGQRGKPNRSKAGVTLTEVARGALLPTPTARDGDSRTGGGRYATALPGHGPNLPELLGYLGSPECQTVPSETMGRPCEDMWLF